MTMRAAPTPSGVVPDGPSACAVPVVPNSVAAASTESTARPRPWQVRGEVLGHVRW